MEEKLIPAPIDNKNVMRDWISDVFDCGDCTENDGRILGFIGHSPAMASWRDNLLIWSFFDESYIERTDAIKILKQRLIEYEVANPELVTKRSEDSHGIVQRFYRRDE